MILMVRSTPHTYVSFRPLQSSSPHLSLLDTPTSFENLELVNRLLPVSVVVARPLRNLECGNPTQRTVHFVLGLLEPSPDDARVVQPLIPRGNARSTTETSSPTAAPTARRQATGRSLAHAPSTRIGRRCITTTPWQRNMSASRLQIPRCEASGNKCPMGVPPPRLHGQTQPSHPSLLIVPVTVPVQQYHRTRAIQPTKTVGPSVLTPAGIYPERAPRLTIEYELFCRRLLGS
ncbi:hypothetical protein BDQ12DRAFT_66248 [Crucibulum laeve]|uniref:Uncharacterized protein n=1 Tax=Crucibulum laeve TaxID=68775 RepID=A0A5C3LFQ8_9AGAR|nr:hypothetical protein BDQ12DRAFT_66248 [Crucibulum laeve]